MRNMIFVNNINNKRYKWSRNTDDKWIECIWLKMKRPKKFRIHSFMLIKSRSYHVKMSLVSYSFKNEKIVWRNTINNRVTVKFGTERIIQLFIEINHSIDEKEKDLIFIVNTIIFIKR